MPREKGSSGSKLDRIAYKQQIEDFLAEGYTTQQIVRKCSKLFSKSEKTIYEYIKEIHEDWAAWRTEHQEERKDDLLHLIYSFYRKNSKHPALQLKTLELMTKVSGVSIDQPTVQVNNIPQVEVDSEEKIKERIRILLNEEKDKVK